MAQRRKAAKRGRKVTNGSTALAIAVGVTRVHASCILRGKRKPSIDVAYRIARHMKISLDELYRRLYPEKSAAA